jgi:hemerythrin-like domain-containing protein
MKPTSILVEEHCLIEQVLACLERMAERCESQRRLERARARDAIVFFRGFVERCHYSKEEHQLLPTMRAMGISLEPCLGCSILQRREEGHLHMAAMEATVEAASAGEPTALKEFTKHARAYIELLMEYIAKQEDCLFPMIAEALPEADKARLGRTLDTACSDGEEQWACDAYIDLANRLADHFNVPRAVTADSHVNRALKHDAE